MVTLSSLESSVSVSGLFRFVGRFSSCVALVVVISGGCEMESVGFPVSIQCLPFTITRCPGRSVMGSERLRCSSASGLCVFALVVVFVVLPPTREVLVESSVLLLAIFGTLIVVTCCHFVLLLSCGLRLWGLMNRFVE